MGEHNVDDAGSSIQYCGRNGAFAISILMLSMVTFAG